MILIVDSRCLRCASSAPRPGDEPVWHWGNDALRVHLSIPLLTMNHAESATKSQTTPIEARSLTFGVLAEILKDCM